MSVQAELAALIGADAVVPASGPYLTDATEHRGIRGHAEAVALPASAEQVAEVVGYCYERELAIVPRGGGTGFAAGAVPTEGGVVLSLERMDRVRELEPERWRMHVEAGVRTATVRRLARENGLLFPPDPGAAEQSQIGGNIATNAGGPHAFKYGVTGHWVTGVEAVIAPGRVIEAGGPIRKDVAGYDLRGLLAGSEGTLGVITAAWLRLLPAPEAVVPVSGFYGGAEEGCAAIERVLGSGLVPAALEFLDAGALAAAGAALPGGVPSGARFLVITELDGEVNEVARQLAEASEALAAGAIEVRAAEARADAEALWRWRDGVSIAVESQRGGKVSEDIVVPVERLPEAIAETLAIGERHGLEACSWGHAGDGNLHSTFLVDPSDGGELERAHDAARELFELAIRLGGSISGEHGIGWVKRGQLAAQHSPEALALQARIKHAFDPKGLMNPGKKQPGGDAEPI